MQSRAKEQLHVKLLAQFCITMLDSQLIPLPREDDQLGSNLYFNWQCLRSLNCTKLKYVSLSQRKNKCQQKHPNQVLLVAKNFRLEENQYIAGQKLVFRQVTCCRTRSPQKGKAVHVDKSGLLSESSLSSLSAVLWSKTQDSKDLTSIEKHLGSLWRWM